MQEYIRNISWSVELTGDTLRSWVSTTATSCLRWEVSSGTFCHGGNVDSVGIVALAEHCYQCQVEL